MNTHTHTNTAHTAHLNKHFVGFCVGSTWLVIDDIDAIESISHSFCMRARHALLKTNNLHSLSKYVCTPHTHTGTHSHTTLYTHQDNSILCYKAATISAKWGKP